jgi:hypothetical protein
MIWSSCLLVSMRTDVAVRHRATHRDPGSPALRALVTSAVAESVLANARVTGTKHTSVLSNEEAPCPWASFSWTRACRDRRAPRLLPHAAPRCSSPPCHARTPGLQRVALAHPASSRLSCPDAALVLWSGLRAELLSLQVNASPPPPAGHSSLPLL